MLVAQQLVGRRAGFRASLSANQTGIASITQTKLAFASVAFDRLGNFDTSLNRFTPPAAKPVYLGARVNLQGAVAGSLAVLQIFKNGSVLASQPFYVDAAGEGWAGVNVVDNPSGADYYEAYIYGNSAGTMTVTASAYTQFFSVAQGG